MWWVRGATKISGYQDAPISVLLSADSVVFNGHNYVWSHASLPILLPVTHTNINDQICREFATESSPVSAPGLSAFGYWRPNLDKEKGHIYHSGKLLEQSCWDVLASKSFTTINSSWNKTQNCCWQNNRDVFVSPGQMVSQLISQLGHIHTAT